MSLKKIIEIENKDYKKGKVLKEKMDVYIPNIHPYFSCRNGMVYVLSGSGGSGNGALGIGSGSSNFGLATRL